MYSLDWFLHEALVIALFTKLYVYIVIWIWVKTTLNIWYKIGLCIYLSNITNIPANYISGVNLFSMIMNLVWLAIRESINKMFINQKLKKIIKNNKKLDSINLFE